jgi:hypothetical protein
VQEFEEDLAAAEVKEEGGAEGGADAAGLGVETKQYVIRKLSTVLLVATFGFHRCELPFKRNAESTQSSLYLIISMFPIPAGLGVGTKLFRPTPICHTKIRKYSFLRSFNQMENYFRKN